MSFKTGGLKTKFKPPIYQYEPFREYTIFAALESCSDVWCVHIVDNKGKFVDMTVGTEDDCANGCESIIDVMYFLKHHGAGVYQVGSSKFDEIVIEEMTSEEMDEHFRNDSLYMERNEMVKPKFDALQIYLNTLHKRIEEAKEHLNKGNYGLAYDTLSAEMPLLQINVINEEEAQL